MSYLLAIDPGEDQGWALFSGEGSLVSCGLGRPPEAEIGRVVCERPHPHRTLARAKDIITLALRAGEAVGPYRARGAAVEYLEPAAWKSGAIPKDVMHARIRRALTPTESLVVANAEKRVAPSLMHNVLDAVGIGLFATMRIA